MILHLIDEIFFFAPGKSPAPQKNPCHKSRVISSGYPPLTNSQLPFFVTASHVYLALARPLRFGFSSRPRAHGRRSPLRPRPETSRRRAQPCACGCSHCQYLLVTVSISIFPARPDGSNSSKVPKVSNLQSTPGSGVRGLKELVLTTDSNRKQPSSGGYVIHLVELPGLGKPGDLV
eukprot:6214658-Pleurochrysis_carterae.AAC.1